MDIRRQKNRRPSFHLARTSTVWLAVCLAAAVGFAWRGMARSDGSPSKELRLTPTSLACSVERRDAARRPLKSIERIRVGERVAFAQNPSETFDNSLGKIVDSASWRMIRLRVDKKSDGEVDVVLLRPEWWIKERLDTETKELTLSVPEVGIHGAADVLGVEPCP